MKKYTFEIKFENGYGGKSFEYFSCKAKNEKDARKDLAEFLIATDKIGSEIILTNK